MKTLEVEFECPKCNRINWMSIPRSKWKETHYKKCQWCKQGISLLLKVAKVKNIEAFLLKQKTVSKISGPGFPQDLVKIKGEGGISVDGAPTN